MKSFRDVYDGALAWSQPHMSKRYFELKHGEEVLATLEWEKALGTLARGKAYDGEWTLKRSGFWSPRVTARLPGSEMDVATFVPRWAGEGTLTMASGKKYAWKSSGLLNVRWTWQEEDGRSLMEFKMASSFLKMNCEVTFAPDARTSKDAALLALIGWYLIILWHDDTAAVAATIVVM